MTSFLSVLGGGPECELLIERGCDEGIDVAGEQGWVGGHGCGVMRCGYGRVGGGGALGGVGGKGCDDAQLFGRAGGVHIRPIM